MDTQTIICQLCHGPGHYMTSCPHRRSKRNKPTRKKNIYSALDARRTAFRASRGLTPTKVCVAKKPTFVYCTYCDEVSHSTDTCAMGACFV